MTTSSAGIELIESFEGLRLTAYQDSVGVWTIGYGHTGGVKRGMTITKAQAEEYLKSDVKSAEKSVSAYMSKYSFNQNQFDALVSFTFNCGAGNLKSLTASGTRTIAQISEKITAYNKAGGKVLAGLTKRRNAEKALFDKAVKSSGTTTKTSTTSTTTETKVSYYKKYTGDSTSLVEALKAVGVSDTSLAHRKKIATANGVKSYTGTAAQNTKMLNLLKKGKLVKA